MKRYIVGLGEALWDVLPDGKKLGGAPANFAYHAAQFGLDTIAISALGEDKLAEETIDALKEHNLNYLMPRVPYPTGTVQVTLTGDGIPTYDIKENVAWDNIPLTDEMLEVAKNARAVCFGSLAQRNVVSRENIHKFLDATPDDCVKIFDINLRQQFYSKEVIKESLKRCNILKINDEELVLIGRMFGYPGLDIENKCWLILGKYNLDMLVLTCGTNGSYVFTPGQMSFQETQPIPSVPAIPSQVRSWAASSTASPFPRLTRPPFRSALLSALRMEPCPKCQTASRVSDLFDGQRPRLF